MNCMRCGAPMDSTLTPTLISGKYQRKQECPKCHVRTFSFIEVAEKQTNPCVLPPNKDGAKLIGKGLKCERCDGVAEILYSVPMSDQLMCGLCKIELGEQAELDHRFRSAMAY